MANCENFIRFSRNFEEFIWAVQNKPNMLMNKRQNPEQFNKNIIAGLNNCKIFEISEEVKTLLCLTDPPKETEIRLPYDKIFLDVAFTKEELAKMGIDINALEIWGVLFGEGVMVDENGHKIGHDLNITICSDQAEAIWFDTFNKNVVIQDKKELRKIIYKENMDTDKKTKEFIYRFVLNFLNFTNSQEVITVERLHSPHTNERRIRKGKFPLPPRFEIYLDGKLKSYVESLGRGEKFNYNYCFDVRGHFRNLESDKWKFKKGQKIWIPPFRKGNGVYINKRYKVVD